MKGIIRALTGTQVLRNSANSTLLMFSKCHSFADFVKVFDALRAAYEGTFVPRLPTDFVGRMSNKCIKNKAFPAALQMKTCRPNCTNTYRHVYLVDHFNFFHTELQTICIATYCSYILYAIMLNARIQTLLLTLFRKWQKESKV